MRRVLECPNTPEEWDALHDALVDEATAGNDVLVDFSDCRGGLSIHCIDILRAAQAFADEQGTAVHLGGLLEADHRMLTAIGLERLIHPDGDIDWMGTPDA